MAPFKSYPGYRCPNCGGASHSPEECYWGQNGQENKWLKEQEKKNGKGKAADR